MVDLSFIFLRFRNQLINRNNDYIDTSSSISRIMNTDLITSQTRPENYPERSLVEFDHYICQKYPLIFAQRGLSMDKSAMYWGLQLNGSGWDHLIEGLCQKIMFIKDLTGVYIEASTVKEKYGGLCFYDRAIFKENEWLKRQSIWVRLKWLIGFCDVKRMSRDMQLAMLLLEDAVSYAQDNSYLLCEDCGDFGRCNKFGWLSTKCDVHRAIDLKYITNEKEYNNIYEAFIENWYKEDSKNAMRRNNNEESSSCDDIGKCDHIG
jgi:hypothetical protein